MKNFHACQSSFKGVKSDYKVEKGGSSLLKEFQQFISRGNVVDLAVAVIIGGAFGRIVISFVNDVLMPIIGILVGGLNFSDLRIVIIKASGETAELALYYGRFVQAIVDFVIIALSIFLMVKLINSMQRKKETEQEAAPPEPPKEQVLLEEIRDILKERK